MARRDCGEGERRHVVYGLADGELCLCQQIPMFSSVQLAGNRPDIRTACCIVPLMAERLQYHRTVWYGFVV